MKNNFNNIPNENYSFIELKNYTKIYNQMIEFLKKTIPEEKRPEILSKFEQLAYEDDDRAKGLNAMYRINEFATLFTLAASAVGFSGAVGATVVTAPYAILYYLWCKNVLKESKVNKEKCLAFLIAFSESVNDVRYPFGIGDSESLQNMYDYLRAFKKTKNENVIDFIKSINLYEENDMDNVK